MVNINLVVSVGLLNADIKLSWNALFLCVQPIKITELFFRYEQYSCVDKSTEMVSYISNILGQWDAGLEDFKKKVIAYTLQP